MVFARAAIVDAGAHVDVGTGAGHVDGGMIQATLPTAILWAWRGYKGGQ